MVVEAVNGPCLAFAGQAAHDATMPDDPTTTFSAARLAAMTAWVMLGGAVGAAGRFLVGELTANRLGRDWTWVATLLVNIAGCLLLGFLAARLRGGATGGGLLDNHPLLAVGFCGALTTFSTFGLDVVRMAERKPMLAGVLVIAHVGLGLLAVAGGSSLGSRS